MLALAVPASAAQHIYCTFVGAKQGRFQGDHGLNGESSGNSHGADRERISFTYQKIELTDIESGTVAIDDWAQLL
jgi:hypothetical protein